MNEIALDGYGELLWTPSTEQMSASRLTHYQQWLKQRLDLDTGSYEQLWQWSVQDIDRFWRSIWDYFDVQADGDPTPTLGARKMPGAKWFPYAKLNYAEHVFRNATTARPALTFRSEGETTRECHGPNWREPPTR